MKKFIQSMLIGGAILLNMGNLTGCNSEKAGSKSMFYSENEVVDIAKKHLEEKYEGKNFKVEMVEIPGMYYSRYDLKGTELETGSTFTVYATFTSKEDYTINDTYSDSLFDSQLKDWAVKFFQENLDSDFKFRFATAFPMNDEIKSFDEYLTALKNNAESNPIRMAIVLSSTEFDKDYTEILTQLCDILKEQGYRSQIEVMIWEDPYIYDIIDLGSNFTVIGARGYKHISYTAVGYVNSYTKVDKSDIFDKERPKILSEHIESLVKIGLVLPDEE